ncbi:hypothetical protein ACSFA0_25295 [Variovorax sp. LT1P1]|uniref:ADP-ribosyltransferase-containing protein n=1 Tax=Variovorax sp. LT1P1 TaxID=3443730 RepID=UPI003F461DB3
MSDHTAEFKGWLARSVAVDEDGEPLVLYHGSARTITHFRPAREHDGIYFTTDPVSAEVYADMASDDAAWSGPVIYPVHLCLRRPLVIDNHGLMLTEESQRRLEDTIRIARLEGRDGVVFRNVDDHGMDAPADMYVVFDSAQVRSALGGRRAFALEATPARTPTGQAFVADGFPAWPHGGPTPVVFHGSTSPIQEFREPAPHGTFFATARSAAVAYAQGWDGSPGSGHVTAAELHLRHPAHITRASLEAFAIARPDHVATAAAAAGSKQPLPDAFEDSEQWARALVVSQLREAGYESMVLDNDMLPVEHLAGDWELQRSYAVFTFGQVVQVPDPYATPARRQEEERALAAQAALTMVQATMSNSHPQP